MAPKSALNKLELPFPLRTYFVGNPQHPVQLQLFNSHCPPVLSVSLWAWAVASSALFVLPEVLRCFLSKHRLCLFYPSSEQMCSKCEVTLFLLLMSVMKKSDKKQVVFASTATPKSQKTVKPPANYPLGLRPSMGP